MDLQIKLKKQVNNLRKLRHKRAIFMDRDGVINNVDIDYDIPKAYAPRKTEDLNIIPEAFSFISEIKKLNYLVIIVSNQPDIALNKINEKTKINLKKHFKYLLHCNNIIVDNIYYCHHHEHSINPKYSKVCGRLQSALKSQPAENLYQASQSMLFPGDLRNGW